MQEIEDKGGSSRLELWQRRRDFCSTKLGNFIHFLLISTMEISSLACKLHFGGYNVLVGRF